MNKKYYIDKDKCGTYYLIPNEIAGEWYSFIYNKEDYEEPPEGIIELEDIDGVIFENPVIE